MTGRGKLTKTAAPLVRQSLSIPADVPIIGLTGALGSGCSYVAGLLKEYRGYETFCLSDAITEHMREAGVTITAKSKQDWGDRLRKQYRNDYLVGCAIGRANTGWNASWKGIVLDGFRNEQEVLMLRPLQSFFLLSVQAAPDIRCTRLRTTKKCRSQKEFDQIDRRDANGHVRHGQQVNRCNDLADIALLNNRQISCTSAADRSSLFDTLSLQRYLDLVERALKGGVGPRENHPNTAEAMMTAAYVVSRSSRCLKRQVGAVIATDEGQIISSGYNDVPPGTKPCLNDPSLGRCQRDKAMEARGVTIKHCPACGRRIAISTDCSECGKKIKKYARKCPHCAKDPELDYECRCGCNVFDEFLTGRGSTSGKMLDVCRSLHAEENAILNLVSSGAGRNMKLTLYTTAYPCNLCANKIVAAGIKKVVFAEPYVTKDAASILAGSRVDVEGFSGVKGTAFFRLHV